MGGQVVLFSCWYLGCFPPAHPDHGMDGVSGTNKKPFAHNSHMAVLEMLANGAIFTDNKNLKGMSSSKNKRKQTSKQRKRNHRVSQLLLSLLSLDSQCWSLLNFPNWFFTDFLLWSLILCHVTGGFWRTDLSLGVSLLRTCYRKR